MMGKMITPVGEKDGISRALLLSFTLGQYQTAATLALRIGSERMLS
jgi:hypothetical protein